MQRKPSALADCTYDVLVIGAGAFGAAAARDAALRGLRTALIERGDFGGATSAECFKMVHGGIRYLQHADIPRLRSSCHERSALLRIAPHLVHPLPIAVPTYGRGRRGRGFLGAGACLYDLLTLDRNAGIGDPARRIKRTRFLSRSEVLQLFPHLRAPELSGAVVFEDGQMYNPARLVLAFVKSAIAAGATACNYVEALEFLWDDRTVRGVRVRERMSGDVFDVRAHLTLNAAGPWADYLQKEPDRFGVQRRLPFSRDAYFVVNRPPASRYGLAVQGRSRDKDALLGRSTRHLFAAPWRDRTLLGVWHRLFPGHPDGARVEPAEIHDWIAELNTVYPQLELSPSEVTFANCGLVPFGETATDAELSFGKQSRLIDHMAEHGVGALVSLVGIRYTTARADAARAIDMLLRQSPWRPRCAPTAHLSLAGGNIEDFAAFEAHARRTRPDSIPPASLDALVRNHGTEYSQVLRAAQMHPGGCTLVPGTQTLLSEVAHAVECEMAVRLEDVVLRRTDIAAGRHPGSAAMTLVADEMARRLGWSARRVREELAASEQVLARHLARDTAAASATGGSGARRAMLAPDQSLHEPSRTAERPVTAAPSAAPSRSSPALHTDTRA